MLGFRSRGFILNTLSGGSTFDMVGGWASWFMGYHITFHFRGTISSQGEIKGSQGKLIARFIAHTYSDMVIVRYA